MSKIVALLALALASLHAQHESQTYGRLNPGRARGGFAVEGKITGGRPEDLGQLVLELTGPELLLPLRTFSDTNSRFRFENVTSGIYSLRVTHGMDN